MAWNTMLTGTALPGAMSPGSMSTGSTMGSTFGSNRSFGTLGHDTHPTWQDPPGESDPSGRFFHDRRKEGRRQGPAAGHV